MTTAMAWRGSLSMGLLVAGSLCLGCGSSSGDGSAPSGGGSENLGSTQAGGAGSAGTASTTAGSGSSSAGANNGAGGSAGSTTSDGGASANGGANANGGAGGTTSGGTTSGGAGGASGGAGGGSAGSVGTAPTGKTEYAPYYEIGSDTAAFKSLTDLKTKAGVNDVTLAFVLSGGGCKTDSTIPDDMTEIKAFIAAGGHVKASFGGADGTYVEAGCSDASSLATAISNFVDSTGITDLDFDTEQAGVETSAVNTMRGQALKMVQDSKNIQVSFTLQTDESGLDKGARSVVSAAVAAGVSIYHVNLMVMDYGDMPAGTAMAPIAIGSLNGANTQLKAIIPSLTTAQAWAMLGATPDIGQNDDNEVFSLQDAKDLTTFAMQNKLGLITFWNIQRDQVCGKGECSQFDNANFDYSNIFKAVAQ